MSCQIQTTVSLQGSVHRERTCSISSDSIYLDYTASKHYLCPRYFIKWYWCVWWSIFERLHFWSDKLQQASLVKFTFSMYTLSIFERAPIIHICRNLYHSKQTQWHCGVGIYREEDNWKEDRKADSQLILSLTKWEESKSTNKSQSSLISSLSAAMAESYVLLRVFTGIFLLQILPNKSPRSHFFHELRLFSVALSASSLKIRQLIHQCPCKNRDWYHNIKTLNNIDSHRAM